jgi:hypothetical protein
MTSSASGTLKPGDRRIVTQVILSKWLDDASLVTFKMSRLASPGGWARRSALMKTRHNLPH